MAEKAIPDFANGEVTLLSFDELPIPPYSAHQITETIEPDWTADMVRTWNGRLIDLTPPQMRKYRVTHTCRHMDSPAFDGVGTGFLLTINCIGEFARAADTAGTTDREPVSGSERIDDGVLFYRPRLACMVESFSIDTDEWGAAVGWTLVSREIGDEGGSL
jgi:hypothetical protein